MWQPQQPRNAAPSKDSHPAAQTPVTEYSLEERAALLSIAHEAIEAAVEGRKYAAAAASSHLDERRGVFTTLYRDGELRGCVGYVAAVVPLVRAVAETAQAASLEDTRFAPVERHELPGIEVSLSVLSPTFEMVPSQVEIGRHGLVISQHGRRGLLLPQVATEHGWDVETFLEQTCSKAGLPKDAWRHGARLEAFTAEVFADADARL